LRTAEALFAHKNAMGPQHPFNAITAAFLSKPAPVPPGAGGAVGCAGGHKPPYGYHGPSACFHHEPFGYNYGRCGAAGSVVNGGPSLPPPLNEQDEDEYLRQEAADQEAATSAETVRNRDGSSNGSATGGSHESIEIEKRNEDDPGLNGEETTCGASINNCGANGCCGCECMLVVNHAPAGPLLGDCCAGPIGSACASATCPALNTTLTREQELAQELAKLEAAERKKSLEPDEEDSEETPVDDQEDDEKAAILRSSGLTGAGLSGVVGTSGALGRTICSTAAGLVMSQLGSTTRTERKTVRRTSSCSSSSASLLNWSSSSSESTGGTGNAVESGNGGGGGVTSSQPSTTETVHLLVFSDPQSNGPA
jgi:hypothetical protein